MRNHADRAAYGEHLVKQLVGRTARHQMQFGHVMLGEQYTIAAIELRVAEDHPASRQLSDQIRKSTGANAFD
jgi:hypothetical protein